MARKFILIDHTIRDSGGHYLEYAMRVLSAAKAQGYQTVLGVNKECAGFVHPVLDKVDPAFTLDYFQNKNRTDAPRRKIRQAARLLRKWIRALAYRFFDTSLGITFASVYTEMAAGLFLKGYTSENAGRRISLPVAFMGIVLAHITRRALYISRHLPARKAICRIARLSFRILAFAAAVVMAPLFVVAYFILTSARRNLGEQFKRDLADFFGRVKPNEGDIIFIPTLGRAELTGVAKYIPHSDLKGVFWHFLFRHNLFDGREPAYVSQFENIHSFLQSLSVFQKCRIKEASFYTDTEILTHQYNSIGLFTFRTLPIPLGEILGENDAKGGRRPLVLAYVGDARDEKGFSLLAQLVAGLHAAGYTPKDIHFVLQSNFNDPVGEPGSRVALAELVTHPADFVELRPGPFESAAYGRLVNGADIILLPYDAHSYYARSSGIFVEALAAGIPVIARQATWMAQEVLPHDQVYYGQLLEENPVLATTRLVDAFLKSHVSIEPKSGEKDCWLMIEAQLLTPLAGQYMHVRWKTEPPTICKGDRRACYFRQASLDLRKDRVLGLMRLPPGRKIRLDFIISDGKGGFLPLSESGAAFNAIVLHELDIKQTQLFAIAPLFVDEEDFTAAAIELLENYSSYATRAMGVREKWRDHHSAARLVHILAGDAE